MGNCGGCLGSNKALQIVPEINKVTIEEVMNIDIWYYWVQVSSAEHDYFAAKELAQYFSRNKNEGFRPYDG